jgi:DNA-directed RNA polymerase beta subunit
MEMTLLRVWSLIHGTQLEDSDTTISRVRSNDVATVLKENILPHLGYDMAPKAHCIGSMIADMFLLYSKLEKPTDKDSYSNKRIDMGGFLLGKLFRDLYFRV